MAQVLDHPRDVAGEHRLVHRLRLDEREIRGIDLAKLDLGLAAPGDAIVDEFAQLPLELGQERRALALERAARIEEELLLVTHIGPAGTIHELVAHVIENLRKRRAQARHRHVAALVEDARELVRGLPLGNGLGGRGVHVVDRRMPT